MAKELEVRLLNVDKQELIDKLETIGAIFCGEYMQEAYTYSINTYYEKFKILIERLKNSSHKDTAENMELENLKDLLYEVNDIITKEQQLKLIDIINTDICNLKIENNIVHLLDNNKFYDLLNEIYGNFAVWARLRKTGDKIELTIKKILSNKMFYNIDDVDEYEIEISDLEIGKKILKEFGLIKKMEQQKERCIYKYKNVEIVIDTWPWIPTCAEIEGNSEKEIYEVVEMLGYKKEDTKIINTWDIYKLHGIDLSGVISLKFE